MKFEPEKEHLWLQKLVGTWTYETEAMMGPDQPLLKLNGEETVRSLGNAWVLCEGKGEMPGGEVGLVVFTFGYDPAKKRFVGTFVGSMMSNLWIYEGQLDAAEKVLTLDTPGPSFTEPGKMVPYQDIIEIVDANTRKLYSQAQGDDGKWTRFMTATYRRK